MLPLVLKEEQIFSFKFWFDGNIQTGMYYQNELFCRLRSYDLHQRARAYHLACKLARQNALVAVTASNETCSIWGSLRSPFVKSLLLNPDRLVLPNSAKPPSSPPS